MRMWMVDPRVLCRKHLLGEHGEIHKHLPSFRKGHSVAGRMSPIVQIQLNALKSRHDDLAVEMIRRGYNHKSPLVDIPDLLKIYGDYFYLKVDLIESVLDLYLRCEECKERIKERSYLCQLLQV